MTKTLLILCAIFISYSGFSQRFVTNFIYGKMVKRNDTLSGYFRFSPDVTRNGQTVYFKEEFRSGVKKRFPSRRYEYFESDSFYLGTFGVVPTITGDISIMIPRIIDGKLQLFAVDYNGGGFLNLGSTESFFIKKGPVKLRIKKSKFKKQMHTLVEDDEALIQKIENDQLKYDDLVDIVKTYNNNHQ
jgi:hypothetical protein